MSEKRDYCNGCVIYPTCKEDNPESCKLYQNHQELRKIMENLSSEDKVEIERIAESYGKGLNRLNKLTKKIMRENE